MRTYPPRTAFILICVQLVLTTAIPLETVNRQSLQLPTPEKRQTTLWANILNTVVSHHIDELDQIDQDLKDHLRFSELKSAELNSEKKWKTINCLVHVVACYRRRRKRFALSTLAES